MSFYTSLSGLKASQADLSTISNNVANVNTTAFKKSKTSFGDIFASAPTQNTRQIAGQGVRVLGINQQFVQGTIETTDKTLDLAVTGEGFFTVKTLGTGGTTAYTRNGAFTMDKSRFVVDTTGARLQVLPVDPATGAITGTALTDLQIPSVKPSTTIELASVSISEKGVIAATYADGTTEAIGSIAMANFASQDGLRQKGDAHWEASINSGNAIYGGAGQGMFGSVRSGALERSNVDITEELVGLISAQRNFQANAKAIETSTAITQTIVNLRT
ncbi:MAG: flagellar hook-basal body complex protein [Pseudomonadota bacterium]|jgi:flagellar hook protein FlgE|uniref:flagellar hook-basal body complex protein n=1 Tax=unclassified Sphingobium TaxID=2611147 RepID=UPI001E64F1D6|nr:MULTISPECIES: flagellar hook-basal body complex protein [unclassified Sphingobium]GLI97780.1 flagellar basal body rod protein FlgG [Sphingobium sp. BS19]CAH0349817.1 Flagellar basal-body rod protein FlgG [Sphingobium sp. CECT 9361]|tara:strand:- start:2668 stop:3489 length:822 start_codon:yes stop_codon:yes gene_type:complete